LTGFDRFDSVLMVFIRGDKGMDRLDMREFRGSVNRTPFRVFRSWGWLPTIQQATLFYGLALGIVAYVTHEVSFWFLSIVFTGLALFWDSYTNLVRYLCYRYERSFDYVLRGAVVVAVLSLVQSWHMAPAYAFLGRACAVLLEVTRSTNLGQGGGNIDDLIKATVYIVRGLFLVYLAIAAVNVFRLMQRDEDWQVAIRAPLIAVVMVAVVEGISALVAPNATQGC